MGSVPGLTERITKLLSATLQRMLWWDDNYKRNANNDKDSVECFRSSGVVKIPRKILRKSSAPPFNSRDKIPISRKTSCPPLKKDKRLFQWGCLVPGLRLDWWREIFWFRSMAGS